MFKVKVKQILAMVLSLVIVVMMITTPFVSNAAITAAPRNSVTVSSIAGTWWEGAKAIDGSRFTGWSSQVHTSASYTEWIYMDMGSSYNINQVRLIPRTESGTAYCFPVDFKFQSSSDGSTWTDIAGQSYTNYPAPTTGAEITLTFSSAVSCRYIRLYVTKLSLDSYNNYYCQIAELNADYDTSPTQVTNLYNVVGSTSAVQITGASVAAEKFTASGNFSAIDVLCPSWSNNVGNLTLKLYAWNTDYTATVAGTPIASQEFVNFVDNTNLTINFSVQNAGDYLWTLSNPAESVGVWKYQNSDHPAIAYWNGTATSGDYLSRVYYTSGASVAPRNSVTVSSIAGTGWEGAKAIDGSSFTGWSSQVHTSASYTEWIYMDMGSSYNINQVRLIPRTISGTAYCFPVDFKFQSSSDGSTWTDIAGQSYTNYPAPTTGAEISLTFSSAVSCRYIRLYVTKLSLDSYNNYYCQIAELNAMFGEGSTSTTNTNDLIDDTGIRNAVKISQTTDTAAMKFTADTSFNAIDVSCPSWSNNIGNLTFKLFVWNTDYNTTINSTPLVTQTFENFTDNSWLKITFATQNAGQYVWQLSAPTETVGVWKCTSSNNSNISYFNGVEVTGDFVSRIYYLDSLYCEPSGYPFSCDAPNNFTTDINKMWSIYGAVNDGTNAVYKFGNEPTYFGWVSTKIMWSSETQYKNDLKTRIRDFAIGNDGYIWSWSNQERWPSGNSLHFGNNVNYIIAVYNIISWEKSTSFLNAVDTNTTATGDVSQGMTVEQKVDSAMNYILNTLNGANGLMIINNGENTGKTDGHASNYWDNLKFGYKDAYSNIYFYNALLSMSGIESMRGNQTNATYYTNLAATAKTNYDSAFYDSAKGRYIGSIDITGYIWDFGFTFVNLEALANGLGDSTKASSIFSWLDGSRIISGDTSTGTDIYNAFKYAPRVNTLEIESTGTPYWWNDCGGAIPVTGTGGWNQHCENGGTIFYTSFYDLLARAKYLGADNAKARFNTIMNEFKVDELRRDRVNSYGNAWLEGVIGEFPESGLVPSSFLYAFMGVDAKVDGLYIFPNLPGDMTYAIAKDINYGGVKYDITVKSADQVIIQTADGGTSTLGGKVGNFTPNTTYTIYNYDLTNATNTTTSVTTDSNGTLTFSQSVAGKRKIIIQ